MTAPGSWWRRWREAFLRRRAESELEEELSFHLDMETEENLRRGLDPAAARRRARIRLGGVAQVQEATREVWSFGRLEDLWRELRVLFRGLARNPGYSLLVIATLGLAIGASTALFAAFRQVVLPPLPYDGAERVVALWETDQTSPGRLALSPANWLDWRERNRSLESMGLAQEFGADMAGDDGRPVAHGAWLVSDGFFATVGARPVAGRLFRGEDFTPEAEARVVLSHDFWQRRFDADPAVVGSRLLLDGEPTTVVGVLAAGFAYPRGEDLWFPMPIEEYFRHIRVGNWMYGVGRLRDGVTIEQAQQDLDRVATALAAEHPLTNQTLGVELVPLEQQVLGESRTMLAVLFGAVCLLLLIACATVASLVVARSIERAAEARIRRALGASPRSLLRRTLLESGLLAAGAAVLGSGVAVVAVRLLATAAPIGLARVEGLHLDGRALLFGVVSSAATVVLAGALPALYAAGRGGAPGSSARTTGGVALLRLHRGLTVAQIAVALTLLIGCGLLVRSFEHLLRTDLGFRPDGVVSIQTHMFDAFPEPAQRVDFVARLVERLSALPGVTSAAASSGPPFHPEAINSREELTVPGAPPPAPGQLRIADVDVVTPELFATFGVPLLAGRDFGREDHGGSPRVTIVNRTLARSLWPQGDAVGQRLSIGVRSAPREWEIVGVVGDVRGRDHATAPGPMAYFPHAQVGEGSMTFVLRATEPPPLEEALAVLHEMAPGLSVSHVGDFEEMVATALAPHRFYLLLLTAFSTVALLLALSGTYGLVAFSTSRRTAEFGIRRVVGARDGDLTRLVLRETGTLIAAGLTFGLLTAVVLTRYLTHLLHGVTPTDPPTFAALALGFGAVALTAAWLPAHRAARRDPMASLRSL